MVIEVLPTLPWCLHDKSSGFFGYLHHEIAQVLLGALAYCKYDVSYKFHEFSDENVDMNRYITFSSLGVQKLT